VYSAAKDNPSLSLKWARHPEVGLPRPDVCIFLDISAARAAERGGFGEEKYESRRMQDRVRELFGDIRSGKDGADFFTIEAGGTLEEVEEQVLRVVLDVCQRVDDGGEPLGVVEEL
jgi:dTMP kinase